MTPVTDSKAVNAPGGEVIRSHSNFNLSYDLFDTYQYGKVKPVSVSDVVPRDKNYVLKSAHDVRSTNLKAPLMQNVRLYKSHFAVPMAAILPLNWDKFFDNPTIGEDVPDDVGCGVEDFISKWNTFMKYISDTFSSHQPGDNQRFLQSFLYFYAYGRYVYSNGSLLASLGAHFSNCFRFDSSGSTDISKVSLNFDNYCENVFTQLSAILDYFNVSIGNVMYRVWPAGYNSDSTSSVGNAKNISLRDFISDYLDEAFSVLSVVLKIGSSFTVEDILYLGTDPDDAPLESRFIYSGESQPLNLARLWAYQICIAHFYTNDKIDYVYSAELFRQLIGNYIFSDGAQDTFTCNGLIYFYDYLSAFYFNALVSGYSSFSASNNFAYFYALFGIKNSLKFMDYFTGSRTTPLAVGDVTVDTSSGQVNIVDFAQKSWRAKMLQSVNRFGSKFENYIEGVFGIRPAYDYHNPMFLGQTSDVIYSTETENTAEAQLTESISTTAQFRSNGERFGFSFDADRNCILVTLVHFDIDRVYSETVERSFFVLDRFDMFNPFTQYIGDQPIYAGEVRGGDGMDAFSYTNRNMEYKQRYHQAAGGFVDFLPGWAFLADKSSPTNLTPRWIRSHPSEMDRFYINLPNYTDAGYFHFIIKNVNMIEASRPMSFNPIIGF